jgi:anaerobic magnesium-protoporphyrin IX monomethyl ester cyclase
MSTKLPLRVINAGHDPAVVKRKILLIYAFESYWGKKPRVPLSLMCLAAALREEFDPIILDTRVCTDFEGSLRIHLPEALLVGMSVMIGNQIRFSLSVAELVRRISPTTPIVWGGPFATLAARQCAADARVDIVAKGDGEATIVALAKALQAETSLADVPNICFLEEDRVIETGKVALPALSGALRPAWDLIDTGDYKDFEVVGSRGCSFECTFCYVHEMHGSRWRPRGPGDVVAEIDDLVATYGAKKIQFVDDNFFQKRKHVRQIAELLIERGSPVTWESTCRANDLATFDDEFLELIVKSGCREVFVGAESGSELNLGEIRKSILPSMTRTACARAQRFGLKVKLLWMIGLIGETAEDRLATVEFIDVLQSLFPDTVRISSFGIYTPYPSTPQTVDAIARGQVLPITLDGWADYYHDNANQTYLTRSERRHLENMMWIQRYAHERNRRKAGWRGWVDLALQADAAFRWRRRWFAAAPEWRLVRLWYNKFVNAQLRSHFGRHAPRMTRASLRDDLFEMVKAGLETVVSRRPATLRRSSVHAAE